MVDVADVARHTNQVSWWRAHVSLLRPRQWTKNVFIAAPVFFGKLLDDASAMGRVALTIVAFCAASSVVYVLNDWFDRHADALHPIKRNRPLASGALSARDALLHALVLLAVLGVVCIPLLSTPAALVPLGAYLSLNVAYSMWLRHVNLLDVTVIASGFVLRVVAGAGAVDLAPSSWIILCTGLLALLLGLGKRRGDLALETPAERATLGHYNVAFIDLALATLAAAVITFYALFTVSEYSLARFGSEELYLTTFPVALAILRYLQVLLGGHLSGSPTEIVLRDRSLQALTLVWLVMFGILGNVAADIL